MLRKSGLWKNIYFQLDIPSCDVPGCDIPGCDIPGCDVPGCDVPGCDIPGCDIPGCDVPGCDIPGCDVCVVNTWTVGSVEKSLFCLFLVKLKSRNLSPVICWVQTRERASSFDICHNTFLTTPLLFVVSIEPPRIRLSVSSCFSDYQTKVSGIKEALANPKKHPWTNQANACWYCGASNSFCLANVSKYQLTTSASYTKVSALKEDRRKEGTNCTVLPQTDVYPSTKGVKCARLQFHLCVWRSVWKVSFLRGIKRDWTKRGCLE